MRNILFVFFVSLAFSGLQAQENVGKERFHAYKELYPEKTSVAQTPAAFPQVNEGQGTQAFPGLGVPGFGAASEPSLNVTARVAVFPEGEKPGHLEIAAQVPKGFKIYALTQKSGGPFPTKIHLPDEIKLVGEIVPSPAAHVEKDPDTWGDLVIESHKDLVKWTVPFVWTNPQNLPEQIAGNVESQMCDANTCLPPRKFPFTAPVPEIVQENSVEEKSADTTESVETPVEPSTEAPAAVPEVPSTDIQVEAPLESSEEISNPAQGPLPSELPSGIQGPISVETDPEMVSVLEETSEETVPLKEAVQETPWDEMDAQADYSLAIILLMAYLGGLILNLMPCVLPVIAPKLHSFVRQAGEARGRIFLLNVSYTFGLLTVLWLLAALSRIGDLLMLLREYVPATEPYLPEIGNMGWGQQFTYPGFVIFMIALVFVMGLSFLGVWEIPIPGMVTSGKLGQMQRKEGFLGAFCMGILTTLLATPCVGPYLGPVFGWVMTQPIWTAFLTFTVIGLGLGTPYLVIGAFPALIRFLPKPGEWMETLKEVMGFFFLGTVVWLFFCLPARFFVPTLGLLTAMWFGCWLIGKTTLSGASREAQLTAWCVGIIVSAFTGFVLFSLDLETEIGAPADGSAVQTQEVDEDEIPWEKFTNENVEDALKQNRVVFIDFTARWCATCQTNGKFAINTPEVARFIRENNIQPLLADWSEPSEEIELALKSLNRNSIPLIVIWIPGEAQPILIDGLVTKGKVLKALEFASRRVSGKE